MKLYLIPLFLFPLTALAAPEQVPYACDNGSVIQISFSADQHGRPNATLHFADRPLTLPQVPAASGTLYRADDIRLHTQRDEAVFEDGKGHNLHCKQGAQAPIKVEIQPTISSFIDIQGRAFYYSPKPLGKDAALIIRVQDTSRGKKLARTLAEQQINLAGQEIPVSFQTTIDRDLIGKKTQITVNAEIIEQGKSLHANQETYPAIKNGQPVYVDMQLKKINRD